MRTSIKRAILSMRERYYEPITLNEIAAEVFVSPFHFSRIFARDTGVSPGRYLTAIRLFEAKRMLLNSSLTVSDIVCSVGYSSVGTFTTRFTRVVGMTPTQYRAPEVGELLVATSPEYQQMPSFERLRDPYNTRIGASPASGGAITGTVHVPCELGPANILIGVFDSRIPQRGPVAFTALPNSGTTEMTITNVPEGEWCVMAAAQPTAGGDHTAQAYHGVVPQLVSVTDGQVSRIGLRLRKVEATDPPIAITLASPATAGQRARVSGRRVLRAVA